MMVTFRTVTQLTLSSSKRWLVRNLTIMAVVAVTTFLFILYSAYLHDLAAINLESINPIETPYFDLLIRLQPGQTPLSEREMLRYF